MGTTIRLPRAQRREQIVRAAAATFLTGGYEKTSMEDVGRAAGVTRLIVYRIFESKEALYTAVLTAVLDDFGVTFEHGEASIPVEHRASIGSMLLAIARRQPDGFRLLWRHTSNEAAFVELFEQFKAAATEFAIAMLSPMLPDPTMRRWAAESLVSHLHESICLWLDHGDATRDGEFLRMLTDGVRAMVTVWVDGATAEGEGADATTGEGTG